MRQFFALLCISVVVASCAAQSKGTAEIYAYKQGVLPGAPPKHVIDESGRVINPTLRPKFNYYIFLASDKDMTPEQVWLNGIAHSVQLQPVTQTPVTLVNANIPARPDTIVLVPYSAKRVIKLIPDTILQQTTNKKIKQLADANELVVVYKVKDKVYYNTRKKLKPLTPVTTQ